MERRAGADGDAVNSNPSRMLDRLRGLIWPRGVWILGIFAVLLVPHLALQQYVYDDAYIHLRMATHLAKYGQPYFNMGEAVNAGSSPAWTVIVAGVLLITRFHPVGLAFLEALISTLGVLAFLSVIDGEIRLSMPARLVLGTVYLAITLPSSIGWMETPLALLLANVTLIRYRKSRMDAFALAGLLPFFRPELAVLSAILLIHAVFFRKTPWRMAASWTALGAAPFLAYEMIYFHTVIPHTVTAKSIVYSLSYADAIGSLLVTFAPPLRSLLPAAQLVDNLPFLIAVLMAAVLILHLLETPGARPSFLLVAFVCWGVTVMAAYLAARTLIFPWYSPLYAVPLLGAVILALRPTQSRWRRYAVNALAGPVLLAWLLGFVQIWISSFIPPLFPDYEANARTRSYLRLGRELHAQYPAARLMTSEIGGLGYAFEGYILDGAGLVTPEALRYHPLDIPRERDSGYVGAIPTRFIHDAQPEIIVSMPVFMKDFVKRGDKSEYVDFEVPLYLPQDAALLGDNLWGSRGIRVFIRSDVFRGEFLP